MHTTKITSELPSALDEVERIAGRGTGPALFLDYDGTLTPIVQRPELAVLSPHMRARVRRVARHFPVAVVSGRSLDDVRELIGLPELYYAGSHGFAVQGPPGTAIRRDVDPEHGRTAAAACARLERELGDVPGVTVERKDAVVAVHFRRTPEAELARVDEVVSAVLAHTPGLRRSEGKKVVELRPDVPWDKGRTVRWFMDACGWQRAGHHPIYVGDDVTDEDAFVALDRGEGTGAGTGVVVDDGERRPTAASHRLEDPTEVGQFLLALSELAGRGDRSQGRGERGAS